MMRVAVFGACLLAGCAEGPASPVIAPGLAMALPQPGSLGRPVEAVQQVSAQYGDRRFAFQGRISADPAGFRLVVVDGFGSRALTLAWSGTGAVEAQRADWLPGQLTAENMLADLVLLYWPRDVVAATLPGAGIDETGHSRTIHHRGRTVVEVEYDGTPGEWRGGARLRNVAFGYQLDIQSEILAP